MVLLNFTLLNPVYNFKILHENLLRDHVPNLLMLKKSYSCGIIFKLSENQVITVSLLEQLVFLQLLMKLVLKQSLHFIIVRPYSSHLFPIHTFTFYLPNTF